MTTRSIERILTPPPVHMVGNGFRVHNFFPGGYRLTQRVSPFFLLDYNPPYDFGPSSSPRGVGVHPHRGFETVTIAFKGKVAHHDSAGNKGVIEPGDVQWMTAGSGVLHKEYHEANFARSGGLFHMAQLWVNLPAKHKMTPPKYQSITRQQQGAYVLDQHGSTVYVIAGSFRGIKGPAHTFTPIHLWNIELRSPGAALDIELPTHYNTLLLIAQGSIEINQQSKVEAHHVVLMSNDASTFHIQANSPDTIVLLLSGEPINEPIAHYGPFLMNTQEEIRQAIIDLNSGKFGYLED